MSFGHSQDQLQCDFIVSLPSIELLKPESSLELKRESRLPEDFALLDIHHFCSMEFGGWGVGARIINNDALSTCTVRLHSDRGTARVIPPSSELTIAEWFDIIIIEPSAVSGSGQLELDIVKFEDAKIGQ